MLRKNIHIMLIKETIPNSTIILELVNMKVPKPKAVCSSSFPSDAAKRVIGRGSRQALAGGQRSYIPLKINQAWNKRSGY